MKIIKLNNKNIIIKIFSKYLSSISNINKYFICAYVIMGKSHKHRKSSSSTMNNIKRTVNNTLPVVDKGIKKIGLSAKSVAKASAPVVEKGVGIVYETMATGLDLGVKGAKKVSSQLSKSKRSSKSSASGGRRSRKRRRRRH
jgi:hypothetical protein